MASVAIAHEEDQGPKGGESHTGSDGSRPSERMRAVGVQTGEYAEVISVGYGTAGGVVQQLLVDQPGPQHPHRDDLFDPNLAVAGVGCGPSTKFVTICVIDLASSVPPPAPETAAAVIAYGVLNYPLSNLPPHPPPPAAPANPFGPPMPGATVQADGSWSMMFSDGATANFCPDSTVHIVFPLPGAPIPPGAPPPDGVQVPPPPITDSAMRDALDAYEREHPIKGATTKRYIGVEDNGAANSGTLSWFSHGAEIYRAEFDAQGKLTRAGQTPEGRSLDTMGKFDFGYYAGQHGITAASIGRTGEDLSYISHVSFTDEAGRYPRLHGLRPDRRADQGHHLQGRRRRPRPLGRSARRATPNRRKRADAQASARPGGRRARAVDPKACGAGRLAFSPPRSGAQRTSNGRPAPGTETIYTGTISGTVMLQPGIPTGPAH